MWRFEGYSLPEVVELSAIGWSEVLAPRDYREPIESSARQDAISKIYDLLSDSALTEWTRHSCPLHSSLKLMAVATTLRPGQLDPHFDELECLPNKFSLGIEAVRMVNHNYTPIKATSFGPRPAVNPTSRYATNEALCSAWLDWFRSITRSLPDTPARAERIYGDTPLYTVWERFMGELG